MAFGHLDGPEFGLILSASMSKMKRQEGDRAHGIDIADLLLKCKQKVVVVGFEGSKTDNIRTLNA